MDQPINQWTDAPMAVGPHYPQMVAPRQLNNADYYRPLPLGPYYPQPGGTQIMLTITAHCPYAPTILNREDGLIDRWMYGRTD